MTLQTNNQTFEEKYTAILLTMQSLVHQIERIEEDKKYKFKFKQETEKYYKFLIKQVESFTAHFDSALVTSDSYSSIVSEIDRLASEIK